MRCIVITLLLLAVCVGQSEARSEPPHLMLWAWERPEDLRFLDPNSTGVAYLAKTLYLKGGRVVTRPRLQPLRVPPGTFVTAVVRIESDSEQHTPAQRAAVLSAIAALAARQNVSAVQVDFDAIVSERAFYAALLTDLRRKMPSQKPLSVTALASWCLGDRWMSQLPLQEAVPMLFRMGPDRKQILRLLTAGSDFSEPLCRGSEGISTDEPGVPLRPGRRIYAFHPKPWTAEAVRKLVQELEPGGAP